MQTGDSEVVQNNGNYGPSPQSIDIVTEARTMTRDNLAQDRQPGAV